jgi:hypothetical protein
MTTPLARRNACKLAFATTGLGLSANCVENGILAGVSGPRTKNPENRFSEAISGVWKMVGATGIEPVTPTMST